MSPEEEAKAHEIFVQLGWDEEPRPSCMDWFTLLLGLALFWAGVVLVGVWFWGVLTS